MVRAIQCHMLNTWTYAQTTPEFVSHKAQRAAHRAEQKAKAEHRRPSLGKSLRMPKPSTHCIQQAGDFVACAKCGTWDVANNPDAASRWKAPCKAGQRHAAVHKNGHIIQLSHAPRRRRYAWVCKQCGIAGQLLHKLQCRSVKMGLPALFSKRRTEGMQADLHKRSRSCIKTGTLHDFFAIVPSPYNPGPTLHPSCALSQAHPQPQEVDRSGPAGGAP